MLDEADVARSSTSAKSPTPRGFFVATAVWVVILMVTLGMSTNLPIRADIVIGLVGVVALIGGLTTGRWRVAVPVAIVVFGLAVGIAVTQPAESITYTGGPAGSVGVRAIWVSLTVISAADLAVALWAHLTFAAPTQNGQLAECLEVQQQAVQSNVSRLQGRVSAVSRLLTEPKV